MWELRHLKENQASPKEFLWMFQSADTQPMQRLADKVMAKSLKVYYFDAANGQTRDISALDPDDEAGWGGLSEFSGRVNAAVARAVANAEREAGP
jgi:hypothetical protein